MKLFVVYVVIVLCSITPSDAWSRRRRRRSAPSCDKTPPYATVCPGNRFENVVAEANKVTKRVDWTNYVGAADQHGKVVSTWTIGGSCGSSFSEGRHRIDYWAEDNCKNKKVVCTFYVVIQVVRCGSFPQPAHGITTCSNNQIYGSTCQTSCETGYERTGYSSSSCLRNGIWSNNPPTCTAITCPHLPTIANGQIQCTNGNVYQSSCTYSCNGGFYLHQGKPTRTCQSSKAWSGNEPVCRAVQCPALGPPQNGKLVFSHLTTCPTSVGSLCYFVCNAGYYLVGSSARLCMTNGREREGYWGGEMTTCNAWTCPSPFVPKHAIVINTGECSVGQDVAMGTVCKYRCNHGYTMVDESSSIVCQAFGRWSENFPRCEAVKCNNKDLVVPQNGYRIGCESATTIFNSSCILGCNKGFTPDTPSTVTCGLAQNGGNIGQWQGNIITACNPIVCAPLSSPDNGYIKWCSYEGTQTNISQNQVFNSVCVADCNDGFSPFGTINRNCREDGKWSGETIVCSGCQVLTPPAKGFTKCKVKRNGNIVCRVFCQQGYSFSVPPLKKYVCGPKTDYAWNHESITHHGRYIPGCTKLRRPCGIRLDVKTTYESLSCSSLDDSQMNQVLTTVNKTIASVKESEGCLQSGKCDVMTVTTSGCPVSSNKSLERRGLKGATTVEMSFYELLDDSSVEEENVTYDESTKEAITDLDDLSATIGQMTKDGRFQISLKTQMYDAIFEGGRKVPICNDGEIVAVNETMCLPCTAGSFQRDDVCTLCGPGSYQPNEGQTICLSCPSEKSGTIVGAVNVDEC